ncbi:MAG: hypothetical protein AB1715_05825, partial [Acidobacteriota bacterium]
MLRTTTQAESEESEEEAEYRGVGIRVRIIAGRNNFSGSDIEKGSRGMFDQAEELVSSLGYTVQNKKNKPFNSGYGYGGELAYFFTPRLGIGLRFTHILAAHRRELFYV